MPDRLQELRRQRALVADHLAWLDREIAADPAATAPGPGAPSPAAPVPVVPPVRLPASLPAQPSVAGENSPVEAVVAAEADAILEDYRVAPDELKTDVKKGCFLYFFAALAFVALGVVVLYFLFQRGK